MSSGSTEALEKKFNELVMEWNRRINLVSRKKTNIYDLIDDSKLFLDYIDFREDLEMMDLGTGAGIPGIIIKLHHPEIRLTLVDSVRKKTNALIDIVNKLGLEKTDVVCSRAEIIAKHPNYKKRFDYIVARSVAVLDDLVKWSKNLIRPGGKLVTVKGGEISEEVLRAKRYKHVKEIESYIKGDRKVVVVEFY
jgi:16S rRNA (guanine527-N7)-methyltransferase